MNSFNDKWCGRRDSNPHSCYRTATSTLRVYQFRHDRKTSGDVGGVLACPPALVKRKNAWNQKGRRCIPSPAF